MRMRRNLTTRALWTMGALLAVGVASCSDASTDPELPARVEFSLEQLQLGSARDALVRVLNTGEVSVGPVVLVPGAVRDAGGIGAPGSELRVTPSAIPTLNPGGNADVRLSLVLPSSMQPGSYNVSIEARIPDGARADLDVRFSIEATPVPTDGGDLEIAFEDAPARQGDARAFAANVTDGDGNVVSGVPVTWRVLPASAGYITGNGQFVGYQPGPVQVTASAGSLRDTVDVTVEPRGIEGSISVAGGGTESDRFTSDLWASGSYVYTGTWGVRGLNIGNQFNAWSLSDPARPVKVKSLLVDARTVNDVKVRADGRLAIITHEGSNDGLNGITLLDLADPGDPKNLGRYVEGLQSGVHNVWVDGDYAYLVVDGSNPAAGLHVLDISQPTSPREVARFYGGESFLHDVYVRDGLAFLSHWNAGLIILDVGSGIAGGSPTSPVEVGRVKTTGGQTHNAWYWPEAGYVFVGEEDFGTPGIMHVVDVRNMSEPKEIATYALPGQEPPHNFWLDEARGILYMAWYQHGIRAVDVTGELLGELDRQGREFAGFPYNGAAGTCPGIQATCSWAPQLHRGLLYVADMNGGLQVLQPRF